MQNLTQKIAHKKKHRRKFPTSSGEQKLHKTMSGCFTVGETPSSKFGETTECPPVEWQICFFQIHTKDIHSSLEKKKKLAEGESAWNVKSVDVPGARLIKRRERPPEATHGHAATGWVANGQEELKPKIVSPYHHLLSIFLGWKKDKYSKIRGDFFLKSTSLKVSPPLLIETKLFRVALTSQGMRWENQDSLILPLSRFLVSMADKRPVAYV